MDDATHDTVTPSAAGAANDDAWGMMGEPTYTDDGYWDRLNSNAYDQYDDLEAKADAWEARAFRGKGGGGSSTAGTVAGENRKEQRERLTNKWVVKTMIQKLNPSITVEIEADAAQYAPVPRPAGSLPTAPARNAPPVRTAPAAPVPVAVPSTADKFNPSQAYDVARARNMKFHGVDTVRVGALSPTDEAVLVAAYDHMMQTYADDFASRHQGGSTVATDLSFGTPVPSYFANVGGETIARRKALSIAGLRNLVRFGPTIYKQLEQRMFSGVPTAYNSGEGLQLMRTMTGNVVDLDSTVLRVDRVTLDVINMSNKHKGLETFSSTGAFSNSPQAAQIAISCATPLLAQFASRFGLSDNAQLSRKIHPSQIATPIPVASNNTDRGHTPLWHYVNAGQDSFHANVPCIEDVIGALLRAPFACIEHYAAIHLQHGSSPTVLQTKLRGFFEDCVADSCFNMKWKAIEEFGAAVAHEGTIVDVLQKAQAANQAIFTAEFFDEDTPTQENEIREMSKLVADARGRDKNGALRAIKPADVALWVHACAEGKPIVI